MKYLKKIFKFYKALITNDTGISSKAYVMIWGTFISSIVILWYLTMLTIEMFTNYVLRSDWKTFGTVITALSVLVLATAWGKVRGEQAYYSSLDSGEDTPSINKEDGVV